MMRLRTVKLLLCFTLTLNASGCEEPCDEPNERGSAGEGDECVTVRDCVAGMMCVGASFEESAHCTSVDEIPGGVDPGCLNNADDWIGHESDGDRPVGNDDEGCRRLVFVNGCNCVEAIVGEGCVPAQPLYRQETWRSCNDCCWRLNSLWQDDAICEIIED